MKKLLFIPFTLLTLFVTMNKVNADTTYMVDYDPNSSLYSYSYPQLKSYYEEHSDIITDMVEYTQNIWQNSYSSQYPYYFYSIITQDGQIDLQMYFLSSLPNGIDITQHPYNYTLGDGQYYVSYNYQSSIGTITDNGFCSSCSNSLYSTNGTQYGFNGSAYFFSNFDLRFTGFSEGETIGFSAFNGTKQWLQVPTGAPITTSYDFLNLTFLSEYDTDTYTEINLNNWPYIVLSLKSYNDLISPVVFDVLGQVCITPVYNYGTQEKMSITDRCTLPYETFTPVRYYISDTDIQNKVVYYVSAYSQTGTNKIKVNTRVFDISYITQANANNPNIEINGRVYPIIPFGELTNTTNENEANNYIPGQSENIFDISSDSSFISELFSNPLEALTSTWTSILTMFSLIGAFIGILPTTLQAFLMVSFSIALCLGIIKILIGG